MKQKFAVIGMLVLLFPLWQNSPVQAVSDYDYQIVAQSDNPTLKQGETKLVWVKLKNTGLKNWEPDNWIMPLEDYKGESCINGSGTTTDDVKGGCIIPPPSTTEHPFRLGTIRPGDRNSGFEAEWDWISSNRVNANFWENVEPGQTITIGFNMFAPYDMTPGVYPEYFAPVIENITWMADKDLHWDVTVESQQNEYAASVWSYNQSSFQMKPGETMELSYELKNTGRETWYKNGANPVHIGTIEPIDRSSELYDATSWISYNRPNGLIDETVRPGDISTVKFTIKAPANKAVGSKIFESFWLVAENKSWFAPGEYPSTAFDITVEIVDKNTSVVDIDNSTISTDKTKIIANGSDSAKITVNLIDKQGKAVANQDLWLSGFACVKVGLGCWQEEEVKLITDKYGMAYYTAKSETESTVNYSFHVGDLYNYSGLTLDFYKVGHESIKFSGTKTDKTTISIKNNEVANLETNLKYDNGDPVPYYYVEVIYGDEMPIGIYDKGTSPSYYGSVWTDTNGKATHKINATNYTAGEELKVKFRSSPLPPTDYSTYVESEEMTIKIAE